MTSTTDFLAGQIAFWAAWIIIPLIMEIIPALFGFGLLLKKMIVRINEKKLTFYPQITVIIPVYNSEKTLKACIQSVTKSSYPPEKMELLLVNNGSNDDSFNIFQSCQLENPEFDMAWMNAQQGKARALNMALFNSKGKYVIHIDSDGILHKDAIKNMVTRFENREDVDCMTGTILTNPAIIQKETSAIRRIIKKTEFYEYAQAFLAGRNFQSDLDSIFTISGAFSAFRKSTILKTRLYSTDTVCEDTQITFQVRKILKGKVAICETALFFVEPIESMSKLYLQRQRWQRGEIEVAHMFAERKTGNGFFSNFMTRLMIYDHTFAFPRMIWYFALICLTFLDYPFRYILISVSAIYVLYVISSFLYYLSINSFLSFDSALKRYYRRNGAVILFMPLFNFVVFWIRFAGIINAIKGASMWKTRSFSEEIGAFSSVVSKDLQICTRATNAIKRFMNAK